MKTPFGHTFERHAILEWIKKCYTCPLTRMKLVVGQRKISFLRLCCTLRVGVFLLCSLTRVCQMKCGADSQAADLKPDQKLQAEIAAWQASVADEAVRACFL